MRRPRGIRIVLGALTLAIAAFGCQSKYPGTVQWLKGEVDTAREAGARYCAAREFASAEAYLEFALLEIHEQNYIEADSYIATAMANLEKTNKKLANCATDLDGDGVIDIIDAAPYQAEDIDGFADRDGKPDLDNDGDGILDIDDADPNLAEDFDGYQDADGVPELDNDGDGIPDQRDAAPNDPEDIDGWEDADGAPDPDNDADGLADVDDACPTDPETFNGFRDHDGCPDVRPVVRRIVYVKPLRFFSGSSRLRADAFPILKTLAGTLDENPEMRLRVEGHTDGVGDEKANMRLSLDRAERVKAVLVGCGVDADRLEAVGFGESRPVASNDTPEGRAKNRRINVVILQDSSPVFSHHAPEPSADEPDEQ